MFLKLNDCLHVFVGGTLFVVLQGSAEVMEDDIPASHTVGLKQVFCKQFLRQVLLTEWMHSKIARFWSNQGLFGGRGEEMVGDGEMVGGGKVVKNSSQLQYSSQSKHSSQSQH